MLSVLLAILKIIGMILLWIFLLLLLILAIALFVSFRYNVKVDKDSELLVDVKVSWLFKIIRAHITIIDGEQKISLKALWFDLPGKNKRRERRPRRSAKIVSEHKTTEEEEKKPEPGVFEEEKAHKKIKEPKTKEKKPSLWERIHSIKDKINYVLNYPDRKKIQEYTLKLLGDELKALRPKYFELSGTIGFDDPSVTGKVIGLVSIGQGLCTCRPKWARIIIRGNFEKSILEARMRMKGKISLWIIIFPLIKYIFKKPIWKIVKKIIWKGEKNGNSVKQQS